jgi:hypothetical protein
MHYQCKNPEDRLKTIEDEKIDMIDPATQLSTGNLTPCARGNAVP